MRAKVFVEDIGFPEEAVEQVRPLGITTAWKIWRACQNVRLIPIKEVSERYLWLQGQKYGWSLFVQQQRGLPDRSRAGKDFNCGRES